MLVPPCHMSQCVCRVTDAADGSSVCEWFLIRMNKWFNFSQLICFNNVKGLKEYCMRWCSHATDVVL